MIAASLKDHIESYAARSRTENALFRGAEEGTLRPSHVALYLANVREIVLHTPVYLARARDVAERRGREDLAAHYARRLGEEVGHDQWAERDLRALRDAPRERPILPSTRALLAWLAEVIDEDPALYLAYILFAEYLVVLLGPDWLARLEACCGIPKGAMTVIGNHAELDRDHVATSLPEIDRLVDDPTRFPALRAVLERSIAHFETFSREVTSHAEPS